jgi:protein O-mannosyl-transferase
MKYSGMVLLMRVRGSVLACLSLVLLAGLTYASALHNPFVYDDLEAIQNNVFIRQISLAPVLLHGGVSSSGFGNGQFRPVTVFTFALNYLAGGENPFGYRLVNLILHALNAVLGAHLLRMLLLRVPFSSRSPGLSKAKVESIAWLAAALFVVHPMNSLAVLLVWKRATLLLSLFSLLAVFCLLALRRDDLRPHWWRRVGLYAGLFCAQLLALGSKENAAILPAVLLLLDLWPRPGWNPRERWREIFRLQLPIQLLGIASAIFLLTRDPHKVEMGRLLYLGTQTKVIWGYVAMTVAPWLISTVYDVVPAKLQDGLFWLAALSVLGVMLSGVWLVRRWSFMALALFWAVLWLAPTSSLIPIPLLKDEDRAYLAFLLVWALPAYALVALGNMRPLGWRVAARLGGSLIILSLLGLTLVRGILWSDAEILWMDAIEKHPDSRIASINYCAAILSQPDKTQQAVSVCSQAYARDPQNPRLQASLVSALVGVGAFDRAEAMLAMLLKNEEPSSQLLRMAGHLAWFRNRPAEAIDYYRRVLKEQPFDLESVLYMARSYAELGAMDDARSLASQLDRWALSSDMSFRLALAELHRAIGWSARACAEYENLQLAVRDRQMANADRLKLEASCAKAR